MASIVVAGDTSGSITLAAPAIAGSNTLTLPTQTATLATLTTPSFASTIGVGGATPATTGSGITFPATQSASSNANTLDDYEEGTWTPIVNGVNLGDVGRYTKIGRLVNISFANQTGITGIAVNSSMNCTNIPFAVVDGAWVNTACASVIWSNESIGYRDELACGRLASNNVISMSNRGTETTTTADPWGLSLVYFTT